MVVEIISRSISTKAWDPARIEVKTPESAVRLVTDCAMGPGRGCSVILFTLIDN